MRIPKFVLGAVISCVIFVGIMLALQTAWKADQRDRVERSNAPVCKVCHCGKSACHRDCGEENMCALRCEGLCQKR